MLILQWEKLFVKRYWLRTARQFTLQIKKGGNAERWKKLENKKGPELSREDLVALYRTMVTIRVFEENAVAYFKQGQVIGNMHMYVGEEAVAAGVCRALKQDDYISSTHRCDGHLIAKGADIRAMMAELMGKEEGICGGREKCTRVHQRLAFFAPTELWVLPCLSLPDMLFTAPCLRLAVLL